MALYVRRLDMEDESGAGVLRIKHMRADKAIAQAIKVMRDKGGFKAKLRKLDKAFEEYFDMG